MYFRLVLVFLLISLNLKAQLSEPGNPKSIEYKLSSGDIPEILFEKIDIQKIVIEDSLDLINNKPMRFGIDHKTELNTDLNGKWEIVEKSYRIWRLKIKCPEALSINLIYSNFFLPNGGEFYIYNENRDYILGAFTQSNNKDDKSFATGLVPGETIILEYNAPIEMEDPIIEINRVIHGYRDFFNLNKNFGDSGPCNNNVNCPEGSPWLDQTNSVAMIVLGNGTRWCTGAMINNTCEDGSPYFLTANHCLTGSVNNWLFYFNYQSPNCTNINGPTTDIINGATLISTNSESDFALLELDNRPPSSFSSYFSGWSNMNTTSDTVVGIHHPSGDIKKISFSNQPVESTFYLSNTTDSTRPYWRVPTWDDGTTEGGSSGSPIFNTDHRIMGQLHGGFASCTSITSDWYGKFSYSWDKGNSSSERLKDWLDPALTNLDTLDGAYFNFIPALDAALTDIVLPNETSCFYNQILQVKVVNKGTDSIMSLDISWEIPGQIQDTFSWTGIILPGQVKVVNLDSIGLIPGTYFLNAEILNTNGIVDNNSCNNLRTKDFQIINGSELTIKLRADNWPEEISIFVDDTSGNNFYNLANFTANQIDSSILCLGQGCYDITVFDSYGDGLLGGGFYQIIYKDSIYFTGTGSFGNCTGMSMPSGCFVTHRICLDSNGIAQWPLASIDLSDTLIELGDTISLFDLSSNLPDAWDWTISNGTSTLSSNLKNPKFSPSSLGLYDVKLLVSNQFGSDSILIEDYFRVVIKSGLNEDKIANRFSIFPNPASNQIIVEQNLGTENIKFEILNVQGELILSSKFDTKTKTINSSDWKNGVYFFRFQDENGIQIKKVIILK